MDLGTGNTWNAFPMSVITGEGTQQVYNFSDNLGLQNVSVSFTKDDQMKLSLTSTHPTQDLAHSMSGLVGSDGTLSPSNESVQWNIV